MTTIGLIGGLGPESTVDYYERIVRGYQQRVPDGNYPQIIINSLNLKRAVDLVSANRLDELAEFLLEGIRRLADAGATVGAITANTPHIVFDRVEPRSPIPLVSIVRAAADAAARQKLRKLLLLGTRFTMTATFFQDAFAQAGIDLIVPAQHIDFIHDKYMNELVKGTFSDDTRQRFVSLIESMRMRESIDGAILAGTELPLLLRDEMIEGVPLLDTTAIHVEAILAAQ